MPQATLQVPPNSSHPAWYDSPQQVGTRPRNHLNGERT